MIKILTYSTNRFEKLFYYAGVDIIKQHLVDNGHKAAVFNFTVHLYPPSFEKDYKHKIITINTFEKTIPEIYQLEPIIQLIQNYKNNEPNLLKNIDQYFTKLEMADNENLVKSAKEFKIEDGDILGQQVLYLFLFHCLLFLLQVKKSNLDKKITSVFGGYHITLSKVVREFLLRFDFVDYLVCEDGRQPMLDIANDKAPSRELTGSFLETINHYEYSKIERKIRPKGYIQVITSVGCPNNCKFCASSRKHILYDLKGIKDYIIRQNKVDPITYSVSVIDDLINPSLERCKDLCRMFIELRKDHNIKCGWEGHFVAKILDDELADLLQESNCIKLFIGAESFDDDVLKIINKHSTSAEYIDSIKKLNDRGIKTKLGLITNLPGETKERYMNSIKALEKIKSKNSSIVPTTFKLFPNSDIYKNTEKFGIKIKNWDSKITDRLPELKGMIIPKEFEYTNECEMTAKEKHEYLLQHFNLIDEEKTEKDFVTEGNKTELRSNDHLYVYQL